MRTANSNEVAKTAHQRKLQIMRPLALFLTLAVTAAAQQPEGGPPPSAPGDGPPPPPPPQQRRDHDRDGSRGDRRGPPGSPGPGMMHGGMGGRPPMRYDGFERLSENEKAKVRAAFEKAWQRPEVIESRDKAMRANEDLRTTLHQALKEIDPEVVTILDKVKPPFPNEPRELPEMPKPDSPDFGRMAVARIAGEMMSIARPDRREETRRFHDHVMQDARVKEELAKVEALPPGERLQGFQRLREVYREVAGEEFRKLREKFEPFSKERGGEGGFRRPPGEEKTPPPEKKAE